MEATDINRDESVLIKKKKRKKKKQRASIEVEKDEFDIPGVYKIFLSGISQKVVGCVVHEDVTSEDPWVYVQKESIEDNIELHEESSEFLALRKQILAYPGDKVLVGYSQTTLEGADEFYICLTKEAETIVLQILERKKQDLQERLKRSVVQVERYAGSWRSLGSEEYIERNRLKNFRSLYEVEIINDNRRAKPKFRSRLADDAVDGYVEILRERFPEENITRLRVDNGVQSAPSKVDRDAQTNLSYPRNAGTQYDYVCPEEKIYEDVPKKSKAAIKAINDMKTFLSNAVEREFQDVLEVNASINMYNDDYIQLKKSEKNVLNLADFESQQWLSFSDIDSCKNLLPRNLAWHPFISGTCAVSYGTTTPNAMQTKEDYLARESSSFQEYPVLLWSFDEPLSPKLYLETPQHVCYLSFCPFNENILVGGCDNGQVILWDLTKKLEKAEEKIVLNQQQQHCRKFLQSKLKWFKNTFDRARVETTAISSIEGSKNTISYIEWISPNYRVATIGKLKRLPDEEPRSLQFVTFDSGGRVSFWDLLRKPPGLEKKQAKKRSKRLEKIPSGLTLDVSPFKIFHKVLRPFYFVQLFPEVGKQIGLTILAGDFPSPKYYYKPKTTANVNMNGKTSPKNLANRIYFDLDNIEDPPYEQKFVVATNLGYMYNCHWDGLDFETGQMINSEIVACKLITQIHASPIVRIMRHYREPSVLLTVSSKLFAIWNKQDMIVPLMYSYKYYDSYVDGHWSGCNPTTLYVLKSTGQLEMWDVTYKTHEPSTFMKTKSTNLLSLHANAAKSHARRKTLAITDDKGYVKILLIKMLEIRCTADRREEFAYYIDRETLRMKKLREWMYFFKVSSGEVQEEVVEEKKPVEPEEEPEPVKPKPVVMSQKEIWWAKRVEGMFRTLLTKKRLNLEEIEEQKVPLEKLKQEQNKREEKRKALLSNKEKIFENAKDRILFGIAMPDKKMFTKTSWLATNEDVIKEYRHLETANVNFIRENMFEYTFDWPTLVQDCKNRNKIYQLKPRRTAAKPTNVEDFDDGHNGSDFDIKYSEYETMEKYSESEFDPEMDEQ